jgi:fumarate hydratase class II
MPYVSIRVGEETKNVYIPPDALWGAETALALKLYHTTGYRTPKEFIRAIALVKRAAAQTHEQLDALDPTRAQVIMQAAQEIIDGMHDDQFPLDVLNSGAGTSLHMNVNEVIANRASGYLCMRRDAVVVDAHNHVNMGQSTNDVLPTAARIACAQEAQKLLHELVALRDDLKNIASAAWDTKTSGRTHLRDALPIRWGQRFLAHAAHIDEACNFLNTARMALHTLWLGGTAVGTGATAHKGYRRLVIQYIGQYTGIPFKQSIHTYASGTFLADFVALASALRGIAIQLKNFEKLLEIASSGPNTGIGELMLPAVQPGSSIMPGKVNPSILENIKMACLLSEGNAHIVEQAAKETDFDLNMCIPLITWKLLESLHAQTEAIRILRARCLPGIRADAERCRMMYENTGMWITLLAPHIGYKEAVELAARIPNEQKKNETVLRALVRITKKQRMTFSDGSPITEQELERLAFPKYD